MSDDLVAWRRVAELEALLDPDNDEVVWRIVHERFPEWARSELEADLVRAILATLREEADR